MLEINAAMRKSIVTFLTLFFVLCHTCVAMFWEVVVVL
jgi:hypothetical protein